MKTAAGKRLIAGGRCDCCERRCTSNMQLPQNVEPHTHVLCLCKGPSVHVLYFLQWLGIVKKLSRKGALPQTVAQVVSPNRACAPYFPTRRTLPPPPPAYNRFKKTLARNPAILYPNNPPSPPLPSSSMFSLLSSPLPSSSMFSLLLHPKQRPSPSGCNSRRASRPRKSRDRKPTP